MASILSGDDCVPPLPTVLSPLSVNISRYYIPVSSVTHGVTPVQGRQLVNIYMEQGWPDSSTGVVLCIAVVFLLEILSLLRYRIAAKLHKRNFFQEVLFLIKKLFCKLQICKEKIIGPTRNISWRKT